MQLSSNGIRHRICTCVGIHPVRVEPASPLALATSRAEALQARRSCASSLDTFTQSCLHRAWLKTRGPEIGSSSAKTVVAHVFTWPPARQGGVGRRKSLISLPSGRLSAYPNQRSLLCTSSAWMLVRQRRRRSSTDGTQSLRLTCRMRRMLPLSKTSNIPPSATLTGHVSRVKLSTLLPGRPCLLYATIFHATIKDRIAGERMRNEQD